jgi:hypothetical protein
MCNNRNPQGANRYSYALNDPINLSDPDGRMPEKVGRAIGLAVRLINDDNGAGQDQNETTPFEPASSGKKKGKKIKIPAPFVELQVWVNSRVLEQTTVVAFGISLNSPVAYDSGSRIIAPGVAALIVNENKLVFGKSWRHCLQCLTCIKPVNCFEDFFPDKVIVIWGITYVNVAG